MAATGQIFIPVPLASAKVAVLRSAGNHKSLGSMSLKLENLGANAAVAKIQESVDGETFTDVSGATATIVGGGEAIINVLTHQRYLAIVASGDTSVRADITYEGRVLRGSLDVLVLSSKSGVDEVTRTYDGM